MKQLLGNGCSSQCQDHWGSPRLNRGPAHLCPLHQVPSFPPPGMHTLKTGTTSVWELSKTEESLGLVPSQVSTVTTRPGATWRGVGGRVSAGQRGTPGLLPPHPPLRAPGSPPLSDSPGPAGGLSPQGRPQQPLCTWGVLGLLLPSQDALWPRQSMGAHWERGADPKMGRCLLNIVPHPSETPAFLLPRKQVFLANQ